MIILITARGGSRGVPGKNVMNIGGKPLIAYSIETAKEVTDNVFVTTDDDEIIKVAKEYGAGIIKRPTEYAQDKSPIIDSLRHAIIELEKKGIRDEIIVHLLPTSPIRFKEDILGAVELWKTKKFDIVASVVKTKPVEWVFNLREGNELSTIIGDIKKVYRRQDVETPYFINGSVFVMSNDYIKKSKTVYDGKIGGYVMPIERSMQIDEHFEAKLLDLYIKDIIRNNKRIK